MADEVEHEDEGIDAMRLTRVLTGVAMAAALAGTGVIAPNGAASAGVTASGAVPQAAAGLDVKRGHFGDYTWYDLYWNGVYRGAVVWSRDPDGLGTPGDAMYARDDAADGKGVLGRLSTGRVASTRGHDSPYTTPWKTGNLTEDRAYGMTVCLVRGGWDACDGPFTVHA